MDITASRAASAVFPSGGFETQSIGNKEKPFKKYWVVPCLSFQQVFSFVYSKQRQKWFWQHFTKLWKITLFAVGKFLEENAQHQLKMYTWKGTFPKGITFRITCSSISKIRLNLNSQGQKPSAQQRFPATQRFLMGLKMVRGSFRSAIDSCFPWLPQQGYFRAAGSGNPAMPSACCTEAQTYSHIQGFVPMTDDSVELQAGRQAASHSRANISPASWVLHAVQHTPCMCKCLMRKNMKSITVLLESCHSCIFSNNYNKTYFDKKIEPVFFDFSFSQGQVTAGTDRQVSQLMLKAGHLQQSLWACLLSATRNSRISQCSFKVFSVFQAEVDNCISMAYKNLRSGYISC